MFLTVTGHCPHGQSDGRVMAEIPHTLQFPWGRSLSLSRWLRESKPSTGTTLTLPGIIPSSDGMSEGLQSILQPELCQRVDAGEEKWHPDDHQVEHFTCIKKIKPYHVSDHRAFQQ